MVAVIDIPLVLPLAIWIWGVAKSDDVTPDICVEQIPFISSGCFSQLLTKALGVAIILGSCLNKIPIMLNMMKAQSAAGISRNSLYGEALVYTNCALYGFLSGHPFTAYGENSSLLVQNVVLVVLSWKFSTSIISSQEKGTAIVGFATFVFGILNFLPESQRYLLMSSTWPVMLYARGSQVLETYQVKHTGNLSIATTSLNLVGALIRVATTFKETGDMVVISGYILSLSLSFAMFVQYWTYLENTLKIAKKTEESKEKKEA
jgi:mannose-P-dolichol utilization defect protein 1